MVELLYERSNEHLTKRPAHILKQVIQLSSLRRNSIAWYEKPVQVTIKVKKSILIIVALVVYILIRSHIGWAIAPNPETGITPPINPKTVKMSVLEPLKATEFPKVEEVAAVPAEEPAGGAVAGCGDNTYANFIYMHESSCNTYDPNPTTGACGIGQANPCSKMPCGHTPADYACQNAFFTSYAIGRYGSWGSAYNFWVANRWW